MISFVTPYWSGRELMRLHLHSIREFFPTAPILVSAKGEDQEEMEDYRREFGIHYWMEDCNYVDALLRLLRRCGTEYVCISDHDAVLLSNPTYLLDGLVDGSWDLVGIEERIREHPEIDGRQHWPEYNGWWRIAPGYMDATFMMFNLRDFLRKWGLRGIGMARSFRPHCEFHYGICDKLRRHKYLLPYHSRKYDIGNVVKDGQTAILWHQWYGSYRTRLDSLEPEQLPEQVIAAIRRGESKFLEDYPNLDLADLTPAWGPGLDANLEQLAVAQALALQNSFMARNLHRIRRWRNYGVRRVLARGLRRIDRWWRLL